MSDICVKLFYNLNYKPNFFKNQLLNQNNKIFCKNFFFFCFFIEYFMFKKNKTNQNYFKLCNFSIIISKKKKNFSYILRAPNRYKKAQYKVFKVYYQIIFTYKFDLNLNFFQNYNFKLIILNNINNLNFFESSLVFLKKKKILFKELNFFNKVVNIFEL